MFDNEQSILFQGDSITDAGRDRSSTRPNEAAAMGRGYAFLAMCRLLADRPELNLWVYNRGVSGNRVPDLRLRWSADCIALKPDVLSILIGVNDLWHKMEGRYAGTVTDYEFGYRELLSETRARLPETRILVCEPFALACGVVSERWYPELKERRAIAARLAREFGATFVPFQSVLDSAPGAASSPERWAADGVHPTPRGHQLLADAWLNAAGSAGAR